MAQQARKRKPAKTLTATQVTTGTVMRIEQPKSDRKKPKAKEVAVVVAQEINPAKGFLDFLREYSVITLAVGFVVANQMQGLLKQILDSFVNPLLGLLFNGGKLSEQTFIIHEGTPEQAVIAWGAFVYMLINVIFVLLFIFLFIKFLRLDKLKKPEDKK